MSPPPILARVWRGDRVESVHRGSVAVVDEDGRLIAGTGAPRGGIYLRSAAKPFQAMPLLEAGGDKAFHLGRDEIALLCASHGGEPRHVRVAARILDRGGFSTADLACGADMPMHEPSARALVAAGRRPTALHNNCSGKHAGLLLACRLYGFPPRGYWKPRHPLQRLIRKRLGDFSGVPVARVGFAVDCCSLPVFHLPLSRLAFAYARLVAAPRAGESPDAAVRRRDAKRLIATGILEPETFSKRMAGPPPLTARSAISAISRTGDTSRETRTSSPCASSALRKSVRFL